MAALPKLEGICELVSQHDNPIFVLQPDFVFSNPVTLVLHPEKNYPIRCVDRYKTYFLREGRFLSSKEILHHPHTGHSIVNLRGSAATCKVYSGASSHHRNPLFEIVRTAGSFKKIKLSAEVLDDGGTLRHLELKGDNEFKRFIVYLGRKNEGGVPIAKLYRKRHSPAHDAYFMEVAPGVDVTLMVCMWIALKNNKMREAVPTAVKLFTN